MDQNYIDKAKILELSTENKFFKIKMPKGITIEIKYVNNVPTLDSGGFLSEQYISRYTSREKKKIWNRHFQMHSCKSKRNSMKRSLLQRALQESASENTVLHFRGKNV